jgi:autophagy-related protein 13
MASSTTSLSAPVSPAGGSGIGQSGVNRNDQIIHRIYLKTVGVLVDGRLTHGQGRENERRKDKWVSLHTNLTLMIVQYHHT